MMKYKQVIIVRKDIEMSSGKMAGQVAHASCSVLQHIKKGKDEHDRVYNNWYKGGLDQKKIILQVKSLTKLENIMKKADSLGISYYPVRDAGYTELPPNTLTCIAFPPMKDEEIDPLTKKLRLWT